MKKRFAYGLLVASIGVLFLALPSVYANEPAPRDSSAAVNPEEAGGSIAVGVVFEGKDQAVAKVPFMFAVGSNVLPAGTYSLKPQENDPELLRISGADNRHQAIVGTVWDRGDNSGPRARLLFKDYGGAEVLTAVALPGESVRSIPLTSKTLEKDLVTMARIRFRAKDRRGN